MQAVILAAGKGTRLRPLTDEKPKPMVELLDKPILEHVFASLPKVVDEIIIVIGYKGEKIREYFGNEWHGVPIIYVEQEEAKGTAHALFTAKEHLQEKSFLVLPGDNVTEFSALEDGVKDQFVLFAHPHEDPKRFGVIELNEDGETLKRIQEKPEEPPTNLISTSCMVFPYRIFNYELVLNEKYGEYFIPDLLTQVLEDEPITVLEQKFWIAIDRPEDIPAAEEALKNRKEMVK